MTPKQKYLFDLRGYLHLEKVLTPEGTQQCASSNRAACPIITR